MADKAHDATDEILAGMESRLSAIYDQAHKEIEKKAAAYFEQFEKLDAQKRKLVEDGKLTEDAYKQWRRNKIMYGKHWTNLKAQLAEEYANVNRTALAYINGKLPEVYALNYNDIGAELDDKVNGYSFELVDAHTVKNLATSDQTLLPYKYLNGVKDVRWNTQKVNSAVLQGILQGESIPNLAKRLRSVTDMNKASSIRNARTAVTGAECKGRQDSYEKATQDGVELKREWISAIDGRTRHAHRLLDGQLADVDKPFKSELGDIMFPGDPSADPANVYNCRCTIAAKVISIGGVKINQEEALQSEPKRDIIYTEFKDGESANEFFYYDDEKRGLMAKKNSSHAKWQDSLSQDELDSIYDYTGGGYYDLNNYLRRREDWKSLNAEKEEFIAQNLDSAISRYVLKNNIVVQRGVMDDALDGLIANYGDDIAAFVGKDFHDDGFLSTTVVSGNRVASIKPVLFEIKVPAGKGRGAYVNQLAGVFQDTEYEFLLRRGANYVIEDAIEDIETGKIIIKMVMKNE